MTFKIYKNSECSTDDIIDVSVIVPTYCEAENLPILIPRVVASLSERDVRCEIVIVDDNSNDGTEMVCKQLEKKFPIRLLTRRDERGLSSAVVYGIKNARGNVLVVMDADLSHPPEKIPEMLDMIYKDQADFVIGSRYAFGGTTDDAWGLFRYLNSTIATWLARPLTPANDPMAGFFAIKRETVAQADPLDPIGFKIGLELIVKARCRRIREVPIHFSNRFLGESKLTFRQQVEYLKQIKRLYEYKLGQLAKPIQFVLVGTTGMVIDLITLTFLLLLFNFGLARTFSIWLAMSWNFWLNRRLTFSYTRLCHPLPQYLRFCLSCLLGALINWGVSVFLYQNVAFFSKNQLLAAIVGIIFGTGFNYILSNHFVFRKSDGVEEGAEQ